MSAAVQRSGAALRWPKIRSQFGPASFARLTGPAAAAGRGRAARGSNLTNFWLAASWSNTGQISPTVRAAQASRTPSPRARRSSPPSASPPPLASRAASRPVPPAGRPAVCCLRGARKRAYVYIYNTSIKFAKNQRKTIFLAAEIAGARRPESGSNCRISADPAPDPRSTTRRHLFRAPPHV